jgi:hypothetical protein
MARSQQRPIGVTDKMYRELERAKSSLGGKSMSERERAMMDQQLKGGMEFSKGEGDGLIRDFPENEPTDAELEKRMGEGPKAKDVQKWDEEYGGHAARAKPKKAEGKSRKDHMADVTAALARLKASKKGTKDEDPRSYGPWADNYDVGDPHPYVTSDARAKREAYELGQRAGAGDGAAAKEGEAMFMRGEQTVRAPKGGYDPKQDEIDENGKVTAKDTVRRRLTMDPSPNSSSYVKPGEAAFTRGDGQRIVAPSEGFDPRLQEMDENGKIHDRVVPKNSPEEEARVNQEHNDFVGPSLGQRYPDAMRQVGALPKRAAQVAAGATGASIPSVIMNRLRGKK